MPLRALRTRWRQGCGRRACRAGRPPGCARRRGPSPRESAAPARWRRDRGRWRWAPGVHRAWADRASCARSGSAGPGVPGAALGDAPDVTDRSLLGGRYLLHGPQLLGQEDDGPDAAVSGDSGDVDLETVATRDQADDREAELRLGPELRQAGRDFSGEQRGRPLALFVVHADTGVVDDDAQVVLDALERHFDRRVVLREAGSVVKQLRDGEGHGRDRVRLQGEAGLLHDGDPVEVADLALGAAHHVVDAGGPVATAERRTAHHGDALGLARHLGVGVVDVQQVAEDRVSAVLALDAVQKRRLFGREALQEAGGALEDGLGVLLRRVLGRAERGVLFLAEPMQLGARPVQVTVRREQLVPQFGLGVFLLRPQRSVAGDECHDRDNGYRRHRNQAPHKCVSIHGNLSRHMTCGRLQIHLARPRNTADRHRSPAVKRRTCPDHKSASASKRSKITDAGMLSPDLRPPGRPQRHYIRPTRPRLRRVDMVLRPAASAIGRPFRHRSVQQFFMRGAAIPHIDPRTPPAAPGRPSPENGRTQLIAAGGVLRFTPTFPAGRVGVRQWRWRDGAVGPR